MSMISSGISASLERRFWAKVAVGGPGECWLWTGSCTSNGYGQIHLGQEGPRTGKAHRVSWELHFGSIPEGLYVCHHCDNPPCQNPTHLFLGSAKANTDDAIGKGRIYDLGRGPRARGERQWAARLTADKVREIRQLYAEGWIYERLAERFGVNSGTIWHVAQRRTWKHV